MLKIEQMKKKRYRKHSNKENQMMKILHKNPKYSFNNNDLLAIDPKVYYNQTNCKGKNKSFSTTKMINSPKNKKFMKYKKNSLETTLIGRNSFLSTSKSQQHSRNSSKVEIPSRKITSDQILLKQKSEQNTKLQFRSSNHPLNMHLNNYQISNKSLIRMPCSGNKIVHKLQFKNKVDEIINMIIQSKQMPNQIEILLKEPLMRLKMSKNQYPYSRNQLNEYFQKKCMELYLSWNTKQLKMFMSCQLKPIGSLCFKYEPFIDNYQSCQRSKYFSNLQKRNFSTYCDKDVSIERIQKKLDKYLQQLTISSK